MAMRYRPLRQRRINRLLQHGFTKQEAINLTKLKTVLPSGEVRYSSIILGRPYVRLMMRERLRFVRKAIKEGNTKAQIKELIINEYVENRWLTEKGTPDYWKMFRHFYRKAIQLGLYKKPPRKYDPSKPHKKMVGEQLDREHIKKQATKYRGKAKTQPKTVTGDTSEWIEQLKKSMNEARTPEQKEQFKKQIERLGGTV